MGFTHTVPRAMKGLLQPSDPNPGEAALLQAKGNLSRRGQPVFLVHRPYPKGSLLSLNCSEDSDR